MKGAVFIAFNQMVEQQVGADIWEQLLDQVDPGSGGVYTSVEDFPDEELFDLVNRLSTLTEKPVPVLVESFGCYLFGFLNEKYPVFTNSQPNFFAFIKSIDDVIHKEVRKLYDNVNLPELRCEQIDENMLILRYQSPRKLCILAEGLIRGAADYYDVEYSLAHETCLHRGDEQCTFRIAI